MRRHLNLRQIEAFKAVIESGTVSGGALTLNISQPAMSKLIAHLEADTGLRLFERLKGRLSPTEHAMRLYDEIGRIFAGVSQVENAVEAIRRVEQERLAIGAVQALAGPFLQRAATSFLTRGRRVFYSVQALNSQAIVELLISRKLDVGLVSSNFNSPYISVEPLMEHPLVCIMKADHPLSRKSHFEAQDLDQVPFVTYHPESYLRHRLDETLDACGVRPKIVLVANSAPTICEFVAAGFGVSLVHPLMVSGQEDRFAILRFEPEIPWRFLICRSVDSRNAQLVDAFVQELRSTAVQICRSVLAKS